MYLGIEISTLNFEVGGPSFVLFIQTSNIILTVGRRLQVDFSVG